MPVQTRRSFLCTASALAAARALADDGARALADDGAVARERPYLAAATKAARWIDGSRQKTDSGIKWPVQPARPDVVASNLYSGFPGIILFLLELASATENESHRTAAEAAADELVVRLDDPETFNSAGLYTGLAGAGFVLDQVARAAGRDTYAAAAERAFRRVGRSADRSGSGVHWGGVTDIISGNAGIGLYLLDYARRRPESAAVDLAAEAADWLIDQAEKDRGGLRWPISAAYPRRMPNFSHGTSGIAYFLAAMHRATGEQRFLDAAVAGARYLDAVARKDERTWRVFHHEPDGEDLFYLGWCHGPAGTARLFTTLADITRDERWADIVERCATAVRTSGIPEQPQPGFWNNVGPCCGTAGVAQFFLRRYRASGRDQDLEFCHRMAADILRRATPDGEGLKWVHAENRIQPDVVAAQTGLMQGAAGIGWTLLRLDGLATDRPDFIKLPDE